MKRFYEILPAGLAWATIIAMFVASRYAPTFAAVFIILFDVYWLLKTIYLSFHLRATFTHMRENLKVNWIGELEKLGRDANDKQLAIGDWQNLYHLVIFPMHAEPHEVVRESFARLAEADYPKEKLFVVLSVEESGGAEARETARGIEAEFGAKFGRFLLTFHPSGIPGELPGKGSNDAWAAREAQRILLDPAGIAYDHVLVSVFDIDTQVYPGYFGRLAHAFLSTPARERLRAVYQPIPFFTNNIFESPALARVVSFSSTFWQMMQQARPERLTTFSSQSIPFQTLVDIGFWHTDVVSEDSRIFWQGYLHYHGDFRAVPLEYPVSMDANVAPTFWGTMKNIYKQQRRWAWGVENTPYLLHGFQKDALIPAVKKWYWSFIDLEGRHSWATNSLLIFALGWLPVFLGGSEFNDTLLSYNLPHLTRLIVGLSMIGIATSAVLAIVLLPPRPKEFRRHTYVLYLLQWALIPATLIIFGSFPALDAQTRLALGGKWRLGFWITPKGRYSPKITND
jgi:cellulose synthase/poly-beta-1,6-N-acetylglucosamine synthase-like glycosyltransferase